MYKVVSESDLKHKYSWWDTTKALEDKDFFQRALWFEGIDPRNGIETQEGLTHRDQQGKLQTCVRWVGLERSDTEWLRSGNSSMEAQYFSAEPSVKADLRFMLQGTDQGALQKQDQEEMALMLSTISNSHGTEEQLAVKLEAITNSYEKDNNNEC